MVQYCLSCIAITSSFAKKLYKPALVTTPPTQGIPTRALTNLFPPKYLAMMWWPVVALLVELVEDLFIIYEFNDIHF
jgi:hypothetical protein